MPGSLSSASLRRRTAPTAPVVCSPATAPATGFTPRCIAPATRTSPTSTGREDGLRLLDAYVTAVVRCAPPANRPAPAERDNCLPYLARELELLGNCRTIVALGGFAWDGALRALGDLGHPAPRPKPRFGHGAEADVGDWKLIGCYHPSQQNTFTGRLTEPMLDAILTRARELSG